MYNIIRDFLVDTSWVCSECDIRDINTVGVEVKNSIIGALPSVYCLNCFLRKLKGMDTYALRIKNSELESLITKYVFLN